MNPFWEFSLAIYAQPGIESACLTLQEQYSANVNLLLWCRWLEQRQIALSSALLVQAQERIAIWNREVVQPLRTARRAVARGGWQESEEMPAFLAQCKEVELVAEKLQQGWLYESAQALPLSPQAVVPGENTRCYLTLLGVPDAQQWAQQFVDATLLMDFQP